MFKTKLTKIRFLMLKKFGGAQLSNHFGLKIFKVAKLFIFSFSDN